MLVNNPFSGGFYLYVLFIAKNSFVNYREVIPDSVYYNFYVDCG